jgi:hypothetical protein
MAYWCRSCTSLKQRILYQRNPSGKAAYARKRRKANKELVRAQGLARYAKDPERHRRLARESYHRHSEERKQRNRTWRENNAPLIRRKMRDYYATHTYLWKNLAKANPDAIRLISARRRARKQQLLATFTITDHAFMLAYWEHACVLCGNQEGLWHTLVADHWIPIASPSCPGTIAENMIPLCHGINGCNNAKNDSEPIAWLHHRFGPRKAKTILAKIEAYFAVVRARVLNSEAG